MQWLNEPPVWQMNDDRLHVVTGPNTDFWRVTHYGFIRDNGHFYYDEREHWEIDRDEREDADNDDDDDGDEDSENSQQFRATQNTLEGNCHLRILTYSFNSSIP